MSASEQTPATSADGRDADASIIDADIVAIPDAERASPAAPVGANHADLSAINQVAGADYTESGVPTFDFVRNKIEERISTALGSEELAEATPQGQQVDEMMRHRDQAAKKRLEEIRKSMGPT